MEKRVKRTAVPDDLPRSPTGRVPKWVIDEAAGRRVDPEPWRPPGSPRQDLPRTRVKGRRGRAFWWWIAGLTLVSVIAGVVATTVH